MIQLVWLTTLACHIGGAAVWWWVTPGGFPSSSSELWMNQVLPPIAAALFVTALFARGRLSETLMPWVLAMIAVFWMAFGISSRIVFFESFRSLWNLPFFAGAVLAGLWLKQFRARVRVWLVAVLLVPAAIAGWALPGSQRAADPATTPVGAPFGETPAGTADHKTIKLTKDAQLHPVTGRLVVRRDAMILNVVSMLSFADRSPDRGWAGMAPPDQSAATVRTLTSKVHAGAGWTLYYKDEDASVLEVSARDGAIQLDTRSRLPRPLFSHANSFAELTVQGHRKLSVSFSPLPHKRIEAAPVTAAARFAYVDGNRTFHVMQASQRQRGPFTELAAAPLGRDPLVLTIFDGGKAAFSVTLEDWASQASTQLSPTAGDGIPVNAIELSRGSELDTAATLISLSLAATTIGRGTRTVGHAAGVYRNRVTVRLALK